MTQDEPVTDGEPDDDVLRQLVPPPAAPEPPEITVDLCQQTVFHDHASHDWNEIADVTFQGGEQTHSALIRAFEEALFTPRNILVVGESGHGKSTIIKKVIHDLSVKHQGQLIWTYKYLNLQPLGPTLHDSSFYPAINALLIDIIRHYRMAPIVTSDLGSNVAYGKLCNQIRSMDPTYAQNAHRAAVLIIDDVDYVEHMHHRPILDNLRPLLNSSNVIIVWACRPPAMMELEYEFTNQTKSSFTHINPIIVPEPDIRRIVLGRIWPFIDPDRSTPDIANAVRGLQSHPTHNKLPQTILSALKTFMSPFVPRYRKIPYPFAGRQENFIRLVSNGDLRVVFGIVARVVERVQKNPGDFPVDMDESGLPEPLKISRESFLDIIGMNDGHLNPVLPQQERHLWRLLNLFELTDRSGRVPLLVNVLQWIVVGSRRFDRDYVKAMTDLGFTETDAQLGFEYCRLARLIEPEVILTGSYHLMTSGGSRDLWTWILTPKGSFYLRDVIEWPEYTYAKAASPYRCLFDHMPQSHLKTNIVELLGHIVNADDAIRQIASKAFNFKGSSGYAIVRKDTFELIFSHLYGSTFCKFTRKSRYETERTQTLSPGALARAVLSVTSSDNTGTPLVRDSVAGGQFYEIKRKEVRSALAKYRITVPNHALIPADIYLKPVFDDAWRDRLRAHQEQKDVTDVQILEDAMRILCQQQDVSFIDAS